MFLENYREPRDLFAFNYWGNTFSPMLLFLKSFKNHSILFLGGARARGSLPPASTALSQGWSGAVHKMKTQHPKCGYEPLTKQLTLEKRPS
jgi:hypothetical protein